MLIKCSTIAGAGVLLALAGTMPAAAFTHHPATPEEMRQTDALNAQALENARGMATGQMASAGQSTAAASTSMTAAGAPLTSLTAMPAAIASATVQSNSGAVVGSVQKVLTGTDGKPSMVNVALTSNKKIVAISADELNYDASRNVLVASLTAEQIMSLPATSS